MNRNFEQRFYKQIRQKKLRVTMSIISSIVRSILILIPTLLMRNIYNALELGLDAKGIAWAIMLTFVLPIIVVAMYSLDIRLSKYIYVIIKNIRVQALYKITKLNLRTILSQNKGDLFNRIVTSMEDLGDYYYNFISTSTWYITTAIAGILMMFIINFKITLVLLIFVVLQIGCSMVIQKRIERVKEMENQLQAKGFDYVVRIMTHNSFIKTSLLDNKELNNERKWENDSWKVCKSGIINSQIVSALSFVLTLIRTLYLLFAVYNLFLSNSILKGDFIALNSYIAWLTPVFLGLQDSIEKMINSRANKRRVNAYLEEDTLEDVVDKTVPDSFIRHIEVSDLGFSYQEAKGGLFSLLSFQLHAGETLFVTGASGVGKSTLLRIMLGLEPTYDGKIYYNSCELRQVDDTWLHRNVIMVGQEVDILPTTLRENVLYSGVQAEESEIIQVLCALKIGYLLDMPGGLDWDMKKNPRTLSDGENKRIAIARAILSKPRALLLDEPTAGLDNINKMDVTRFIEKSVEGLLLIVTHDKIFTEDAHILNMQNPESHF